MIPQRPTEYAYDDAPRLAGLLAADEDSTADLQGENTADLSPIIESKTADVVDSAALREVITEPTVDSDSSPVNDTGAADVPTLNVRPLAPMPKKRAMGFFLFAACALMAILVTTQRPTESSSPTVEVQAATLPPMVAKLESKLESKGAEAISPDARQASKPAEAQAKQRAEPKRTIPGADASLGSVAFASRSIVTSEQSVAAVFILKRTQVVRGRALVQWSARSGGADAGIDFSDASGTARFADGQRQVAIYVPLRNDLLKEEDETFKVCLRAPQQARIGGRSCAEATILDDDDIGPT